jgi:hypothetical protein
MQSEERGNGRPDLGHFCQIPHTSAMDDLQTASWEQLQPRMQTCLLQA